MSLSKCLAVLFIAVLAFPGAFGQQDLPGFPKNLTNDQTGAPIFFDFTGDGVDELLHACADYTVDIYQSGGGQVPGWPVTAGWHTWNMTPAVGDLDGDGVFEVVTATNHSKVHAYHADGSPVAGFPRNLGAEMSGACCLADLDGDGAMEILVQPRNKKIYAIDGDGTDLPGWPVSISISESGSQTPAVADLDGDGVVEIIATSQGIGSLLHVLHPDGSPAPGFPITVTYLVGSPVIVDLDRDGDLEIILTVGSDLQARHHDGTLLPGFPVDCGSWTLYTTPAVGDIDRDGWPEIVFGSQDDNVYIVRRDGSFQPGWPSPPTTGSVHGTPCLADLDRNGDLEILVAGPTSGSGRIYGWHHDGMAVNGFPWSKPSSFYGGVTLGDMNSDGMLDVAAAGRSKTLFAWTTPFLYDATSVIHGAYRVNRHNNAVLDLHPMEGQVAVELEVPASATPGGSAALKIRVRNDTPSAQYFYFYVEVEIPSGLRAYFFYPFLAYMKSGGSAAGSFPFTVPPSLPPGGYRFISALVSTQGDVLHWDGELFSVL